MREDREEGIPALRERPGIQIWIQVRIQIGGEFRLVLVCSVRCCGEWCIVLDLLLGVVSIVGVPEVAPVLGSCRSASERRGPVGVRPIGGPVSEVSRKGVNSGVKSVC